MIDKVIKIDYNISISYENSDLNIDRSCILSERE